MKKENKITETDKKDFIKFIEECKDITFIKVSNWRGSMSKGIEITEVDKRIAKRICNVEHGMAHTAYQLAQLIAEERERVENES